MITATTSMPISKPTIRLISLFWSFEKAPPFVVSSLTDALVITFTVDELILVDVTGIVAVVVFGSIVVVAAAVLLAAMLLVIMIM